MPSKKPRNRVARNITITPLGRRILQQLDAGVYKTRPSHPNRGKTRGKPYAKKTTT